MKLRRQIVEVRVGRLVFFASVLAALAVTAKAAPSSAAVEREPLHVVSTGIGPVSVVFVSGLGESLDTWDKVAPAVAAQALTIRYDRSGIGGSPATLRHPTIETMAEELH